MGVEQAVDDQFRTRYLGLYLDSISRAIYEDGVSVRGYYVWSLMDNFGMLKGDKASRSSTRANCGDLEWSAGYSARFGIVHVDYKTLVRTPKKSASYLKKTFKDRRAKSIEC